MFNLQCERCRGALSFPARIDRKDAVNQTILNHGWFKQGKKLFCDGCAELLELIKPKKKSTPKPVTKTAPKKDDEDDYIELGE